MCEMKLGKLIFSHNFLRPGQKKKVVRLNHDMKQLYSTLSQPNQSKLLDPRCKKKGKYIQLLLL
jgi:hypothetical protein